MANLFLKSAAVMDIDKTPTYYRKFSQRFFTVKCEIHVMVHLQGDPNQNLLFQLALSLNVGIPDPMLVKPKCV